MNTLVFGNLSLKNLKPVITEVDIADTRLIPAEYCMGRLSSIVRSDVSITASQSSSKPPSKPIINPQTAINPRVAKA